MPISYSIDTENNVILESWTGMITAADLAAHCRRYLADPAVMAIRRTIVDLREARILFCGEQLAEAVESIVLPTLQGIRWTTAIVVTDPMHFEISRQYRILAESYSRDAIFGTREAAMEWMRGEHP